MLLFTVAMMAAAAATNAPPSQADAQKTCRQTTNYRAWQQGKPLTPRKLNELPPAETYMAVYRHVGTCEVPLTMSDYRNAPRR